MAVLVLLMISAQAYSQTASISGIVTDESGGVLPGADITVINAATNVTQKLVTNETGAYSVPGLPVGSYRVTAEFTGFQTQTKTDIKLGAVSQLRVNFELAVAARDETIEVSVARENPARVRFICRDDAAGRETD